MADDKHSGFPGFPPEATHFLAELRDHNDRDWFNAHKATYEQAIRGPAEALLAHLEPALSTLTDGPVTGKVFRIHRDVRFSKDRRPYNAHLHIAFPARGGPSGVTACGFYFGLEPERVVLGAGGFDFAGPVLDAYRAAVADQKTGVALERILTELAAQGFRIEGAELKRTPAPFPADHPRAGLLRRKGLTAWRDLADPQAACSDRFFGEAVKTFEALAPLVRWLAAL